MARVAMDRRPVADGGFYFDCLTAAGAKVEVWETDYWQALHGAEAVFEFVRGTGLLPILEGLAEEPRATFLDTYRGRLRAAYPVRDDGTTLYAFRRLFLIAVRR